MFKKMIVFTKNSRRLQHEQSQKTDLKDQGQTMRRTVSSACGFRRSGHPNEIDKIFKIHKKHCTTCKDTETLPTFSREMGLINGLNGVQMTRKKGAALADNVTVQVVRDDRTSTVVAYSVRKEQVIEAIFQK